MSDPTLLLRELETIYGLTEVHVRIARVTVFGYGSKASADVYLEDGGTITFDTLRQAIQPNVVIAELAAVAGAAPKLNQQQCVRALVLMRQIAEHEQASTEDDIARDWGVTYLQAAEVIDLDMSDQGERWGAFVTLARGNEQPVVLRHLDGTRYVRCGVFKDAIREREGNLSSHALALRMARVGWGRPGTKGRIKATCPNRDDNLQWTFYVVPPGWE